MSRREHYSTALAQAQGIVSDCQALFEVWEPGMNASALFEQAQSSNLLGLDSERRIRNVVVEGFGSRFLREPYIEAAPQLKRIFSTRVDNTLKQQLIFLYACRQHGVFFDFVIDVYWRALRNGGTTLSLPDVHQVIDRGLLTGKLKKNWSVTMRKRVSSYVLGTAHDFGLVGEPRAGSRKLNRWKPDERFPLYLAYDLHFLGLSDDEVANNLEWKLLGLQREDVTLYLNRLQNQGHLIAQDTGHLCRIDWTYPTREALTDVIIRSTR